MSSWLMGHVEPRASCARLLVTRERGYSFMSSWLMGHVEPRASCTRLLTHEIMAHGSWLMAHSRILYLSHQVVNEKVVVPFGQPIRVSNLQLATYTWQLAIAIATCSWQLLACRDHNTSKEDTTSGP